MLIQKYYIENIKLKILMYSIFVIIKGLCPRARTGRGVVKVRGKGGKFLKIDSNLIISVIITGLRVRVRVRVGGG